MNRRFDEIYESINSDWFDDENGKIQQCVDVMLEALRDIEMSEPVVFQKIKRND